jgi:hypothetical protein
MLVSDTRLKTTRADSRYFFAPWDRHPDGRKPLAGSGEHSQAVACTT